MVVVFPASAFVATTRSVPRILWMAERFWRSAAGEASMRRRMMERRESIMVAKILIFLSELCF
jgi:hypothetical protein